MIGAAAADLEPQRGDLRVIDIDAGHAGAPVRGDADLAERFDDDPFDQFDQLPHLQFASTEVQQQVGHQLARAVVGDLAAAVARHHGNVADVEQVFAPPCQAQGVDRRMFGEPDLVGRGRIARAVERTHGLQRRAVFGDAEVAQPDRKCIPGPRGRRLASRRYQGRHQTRDHSAICTIGWSDRS